MNSLDLVAIKASLPIEGLLASRGVNLRRGRGPCPICNTSDRSHALSVRGGRWKCFACGKAGSVLDLVAELDGLSLRDAIKRCAELAGVRPGGTTKRPPPPPRVTHRQILGGLFRRTADLRDTLQQIADDEGRDVGTRLDALIGARDCNADLDTIMNGSAALHLLVEVWL